MKSICGADCNNCNLNQKCKGCIKTCASPFGGKCLAAEYIKVSSIGEYIKFKEKLISEFNALGVEELPKITQLNELPGFYVNLEYKLPDGSVVKFLNDSDIYLGCQIEISDINKYFGFIACLDFILISTYGIGGSNPELVIYKKR
ncbi:MAG: DUF3795 domain-containing protein [Bacilli bacterium]|nr:DUF3795 domain-containing protein [Bacilli bacterium]